MNTLAKLNEAVGVDAMREACNYVPMRHQTKRQSLSHTTLIICCPSTCKPYTGSEPFIESDLCLGLLVPGSREGRCSTGLQGATCLSNRNIEYEAGKFSGDLCARRNITFNSCWLIQELPPRLWHGTPFWRKLDKQFMYRKQPEPYSWRLLSKNFRLFDSAISTHRMPATCNMFFSLMTWDMFFLQLLFWCSTTLEF